MKFMLINFTMHNIDKMRSNHKYETAKTIKIKLTFCAISSRISRYVYLPRLADSLP
jgi:hypothetical protein